ncbi:MAG: hypothetical protein NZO41_02625 [Candidatus Bipolaricaulota bacterium]|nr:hypothetical protein [Candidatus Bipolaricaulota bacterium]MDW8141235.1 hypothetical protein [Candidatus Bipolaricaulota bacterium]
MLSLRGLGGGLLLGFGLAGLGLGTLYLVPRYLQPIFAPVYRTEHFEIYYHRDSQIAKSITEWGDRLERELTQALETLEIEPDRLSLPIEVLMADDPSKLSAEIQRRRNPYRGGVPRPLLGISADHEIQTPMLEFLLRQGWGNPSYRFLRVGLMAALTGPSLEPLVAALPERLSFTLEELLRWERRGGFAISQPLSEEDELLFPSEPLAQAHAATLVRFLLELGGRAKLRRLWGMHSFEEATRALYGLTLTELEARWRRWLEQEAAMGSGYSFYRGKSLAAVGRREEAQRWLERALAEGDERVNTELARLRCELPSPCVCARFCRASENFVVYYDDPDVDGESMLMQAEASLSHILARLHLAREHLPSPLVIVLSDDDSPSFSPRDALRGVVRVGAAETVGYALARVIVQHWQKHQTYSEVLRRGLAYYLSGRDYLKEAELLSMTPEWVPFASLDVDAYRFESVRVGAAAMVGYLLESRGIEKLRALWVQTAPLGGDRSLDGALRVVYGLTREQLERELIARWARQP